MGWTSVASHKEEYLETAVAANYPRAPRCLSALGRHHLSQVVPELAKSYRAKQRQEQRVEPLQMVTSKGSHLAGSTEESTHAAGFS